MSRERCPEDRRRVTCRIHRRGLALLERVDPVADELDDALGEMLTPAELRRLIGLLDRVRARLGGEE